MTSIFVGVDGGGTQTRAVVARPDGTVLGRGQSGSSNLYNLGLERATQNILGAIESALAEAQIAQNEIASFGFGLAGVVSEAEKSRWKAALSPTLGEELWVEEDAVAALVGAFGPQELKAQGGAILIAGTGANCLGQNARGKRERADGWGPILGDRGSGFWLGEAGIRAAVAAFDGAAPPTKLQNALLEHFQIADLNELVGVIYGPNFERQRIAAFSNFVASCAAEGDETARALLKTSGELLGQTARGVLEKLGVSRLALIGGLLENNALVRESLSAKLGSEIEILEAKFSPAVGAALLPLLDSA